MSFLGDFWRAFKTNPQKIAEPWKQEADVWTRRCLSQPFNSAAYVCTAYAYGQGYNWTVWGGGAGHASSLQEAKEAADTFAHEQLGWTFREAIR